MALAEWTPIDTREDVDEIRFQGDPAELVDAMAEMLELAQRPAWHRQAACRGQGPALFFPTRGDDLSPARALCAGCPVLAECLEAGMREHNGLWGGTSERERRHLRREAA